MSLQFDFLPVNIRKSNEEQSSKEQLDSCLEAFFKDQKWRQASKAQSKLVCIDVTIETSGAKKKKRTSRTKYYKKVKRNQIGKEGVLTKECDKNASKTKIPLLKQVKKNISVLQSRKPDRSQVY